MSDKPENVDVAMSDLEDMQLQIWQGSTELFRAWAIGNTSPQDIEDVMMMARSNADWQTLAVCCVVISAIYKTTGVTPRIKSQGGPNLGMDTSIPFSEKSEFFEPIEAAIRKIGGTVAVPLQIALKSGGYSQDSRVFIQQHDYQHFETDWKNKDPTRFSARFRAAATVLHRTGHQGLFRLRHDDGTLKIQPIE